jgi:tetratricopeptide (TPR) repeat protein
LNAIAQILVVHPDPKVRDASEAVRFAQRAAKITEYQKASVLETLAAAYAAAGQLDRAATTAQTAIKLASASRAEELVDYLRKQLELYKQAKL